MKIFGNVNKAIPAITLYASRVTKTYIRMGFFVSLLAWFRISFGSAALMRASIGCIKIVANRKEELYKPAISLPPSFKTIDLSNDAIALEPAQLKQKSKPLRMLL